MVKGRQGRQVQAGELNGLGGYMAKAFQADVVAGGTTQKRRYQSRQRAVPRQGDALS